jgi:hypothetical protein
MDRTLDYPPIIVAPPYAPERARPVDFRRLLGAPAWRSLPFAVQHRFSAAVSQQPHAYDGVMQVRASVLGLIIAQVCRLLGTPLAPWRADQAPVHVDVHTDPDGALVWDRTYSFPGRRPILVSSRKRVDARGTLMEVAHGGLGMTLRLTAEDGALHFRSTGYFIDILGVRAPIPAWLTPGRAHVVHEDVGGGGFRFTLRFVHALAGETFFQTGLFRDPAPEDLP